MTATTIPHRITGRQRTITRASARVNVAIRRAEDSAGVRRGRWTR